MGVGCAPKHLDLLKRAVSGPLAIVADPCFTSGVGKPSIPITPFSGLQDNFQRVNMLLQKPVASTKF